MFPNFLSKTWVCLMVWERRVFVDLKRFSASNLHVDGSKTL